MYTFLYIICNVAAFALQCSWCGLLLKLTCIFREFVNTQKFPSDALEK